MESNSIHSIASAGIKGTDAFAKNKEIMFPFYLIIFYLFLEFFRPQYIVPAITYLHLPAITLVFILLSFLFSVKLYLKDKQTVLFIVLLCEMVIHGPIAVNNYWAFQVFYVMSLTFIAYLGIINIVDSYSKYYKLINVWLFIFFLLSIVGILNKGMGVGGFIADENDFCMALNMVLPFTMFGLFSANRSRKIYLIVLTCTLLASILSYSRGGFIGLISVTIYCWFKSNKKFLFATIIGFFAMFALFIAPHTYWERVASITTETQRVESKTQTGTGSERVYSWKLGWHIFLKNPILGVGQGNYPWTIGKAEEELGVQWQERSLAGRAAHSLYFTLLPELGLVGVMIFTAMIIYSIKDLKYIKKEILKQVDVLSREEAKKIYYLALALEGSMVAYLITSVFISTLYYPNFWILCGFIVSLKKLVAAKYEFVTLPDPKHKSYNLKLNNI